MLHAAGLGEIHCGLWEGLQQADPCSPGASVLDTLMQVCPGDARNAGGPHACLHVVTAVWA